MGARDGPWELGVAGGRAGGPMSRDSLLASERDRGGGTPITGWRTPRASGWVGCRWRGLAPPVRKRCTSVAVARQRDAEGGERAGGPGEVGGRVWEAVQQERCQGKGGAECVGARALKGVAGFKLFSVTRCDRRAAASPGTVSIPPA